MICPWISRAPVFGVILASLTAGATIAGHAAAPEAQGATTTVRSGNHPDFGRVVIDRSDKTTYQLDQDGDHVVVRFADDIKLGNPPAAPRNVLSITTDGQTLDLILKHGVKLHPTRLDGRVVFDILDGSGNAASPAKSRPGPHPPSSMALAPELGGRSITEPAAAQPASTAERTPVSAQPLPLTQSTPTQSTPAQSTPAQTLPGPKPIVATQQTPPGRDVLPENVGPIALLARRVKMPAGLDGSAFQVAFDSTTGAASFRNGDNTYIVFDERRPVDMGALRSDPVFSAATVQLLPNGTLFRIPLPPARSIALTQMPQGWRIAALTTAPRQQPIAVSYADGYLRFAAEQAGDVISLADPDTGATLLVGTQHRPGQGVVITRRGSEFILRPTIQGVVVEPLSDAITFKQTPTGFSLTGGPAGLLLSPPTSLTDSLLDAAMLTRRLVFSTIPPEALLRRATRQIAEAATSAPMARGIRHRIAAQSFMSLGLAAEAESLLHMAAEQDPKEAASAETGALTAIAALLAGRPEEADALADPRLDGTDEISLWRAVRQAMQDDGSPGAAAVFAATAPLVFQYPRPIRDHILPLIVETMINGGEIAPAAHLLGQHKNDPGLAYARALMKQAEGATDQALGMLDALANGHDQFDRARAAIRAVELRLASRKLDKVKAADALDKLLYAWRGDARELALRERIADLRAQTGASRVALTTLRQAETDFPEQATPIHERLKDMFAGMIRDQSDQQISPIDFVSTVDENADLMLDSTDDDAEQQSLAERLLALDLPERAKPVLAKLMRSSKSDVAKARFGASLATLQSRDGNDAGVRTTLDGSEGHDLPPDLVEQRMILRAQSVAHMGDPAAANAMLTPLRTSPAIQARAQILENASDWAGAERAWSDCVGLTLPENGMLDDAQTRTVLRLATATARAGDDPGLAGLRTRYGSRIGASPLGDMFRLLTVEPIRTTADIKRSKQEMNLATSLPADLKSLQPGVVAR
jgi:hypothetical protein